MMQTYLHHLLGIIGCLLSIYLGGFMGSIGQLSGFTEFSSPFVSLRAILAMHKMQSGILYFLNGLMMVFSFFLCRMCFQYYLIFKEIEYFLFYRHLEFWALYPEEQHLWIKIAVAFYLVLYILNIYWFSKILLGLYKALGIDKAIQLSCYEYEPYGGYDEVEEVRETKGKKKRS